MSAGSSRSRPPRRSSHSPKHPYTEALLSAVPKPDPRLRAERIILEREVADPANPPPGLPLPSALPLRGGALPAETPPLQEIEPGRWVAATARASCRCAACADPDRCIGKVRTIR